jgi:hypothetical protein
MEDEKEVTFDKRSAEYSPTKQIIVEPPKSSQIIPNPNIRKVVQYKKTPLEKSKIEKLAYF